MHCGPHSIFCQIVANTRVNIVSASFTRQMKARSTLLPEISRINALLLGPMDSSTSSNTCILSYLRTVGVRNGTANGVRPDCTTFSLATHTCSTMTHSICICYSLDGARPILNGPVRYIFRRFPLVVGTSDEVGLGGGHRDVHKDRPSEIFSPEHIRVLERDVAQEIGRFVASTCYLLLQTARVRCSRSG